ncbi:VOC family protein [Flavobacteriaceae bacterium TP-CH-4]|uniref:VOC family protein n=1 Tax=Pelagihabitans pacificus TaxID=2696054 RepID=A0A967AV18_9FLAO|nr:VOC family protein [Pelagihabitans pacificus]NHF60472.1 VOC family protein [Pelagihabitans pacificus]
MAYNNTLPFQIDRLDHVAFYVRDMEASANWYKTVLGLQRYQPAEWGSFPIFMLAGKTGLALFPASADAKPFEASSRYVCMEHFAFHVSNEDFRKARAHYESLGLDFEFRDHHYFHSIYTEDPDGHTVELTTLVVSVEDFY